MALLIVFEARHDGPVYPLPAPDAERPLPDRTMDRPARRAGPRPGPPAVALCARLHHDHHQRPASGRERATRFVRRPARRASGPEDRHRRHDGAPRGHGVGAAYLPRTARLEHGRDATTRDRPVHSRGG
ncbi:hypothetical protein G6F22_021281 [Rhizopus arrhizus]|nr:hypothetical protein G6F22_021281 [Rhizopus arrhizus]